MAVRFANLTYLCEDASRYLCPCAPMDSNFGAVRKINLEMRRSDECHFRMHVVAEMNPLHRKMANAEKKVANWRSLNVFVCNRGV